MNNFYFGWVLCLVFAFAVIDAKTGKIPDKLIITSFFALVLWHIFAPLNLPVTALQSVAGFFAGGLPIFFIILITKGGMGAGDMKLLALIGAYLGAKSVILILLLSIVICGLYSAILILLKIKTLKSEIVFAPFIAVSTFIAVFFSQGAC